MKLEPIIQSEISQKENKDGVLTLVCQKVLSAEELMLLNSGVGENSL